MRVILDQQLYDKIWDFIKQDFHFNPSMDQHTAAFAFPMRAACFGLKRLWDDRQEETVNGIMMSLFPKEELYAPGLAARLFYVSPKRANTAPFSLLR